MKKQIFLLSVFCWLSISNIIVAQQTIINKVTYPDFVIERECHKSTYQLKDAPVLSPLQMQEIMTQRNRMEKKENEMRQQSGFESYTRFDKDTILQNYYGESHSSKSSVMIFNGMAGGIPPDANGDVGNEYYFQTVNSFGMIYHKDSTVAAGPFDLRFLFSDVSTSCFLIGDPVVLFDKQSERWIVVVMQFERGKKGLLIAVSDTPDPLGKWNQYNIFRDDVLLDYPKLAIWRDAYYIACNSDTTNVFALERDKMINGQNAQVIGFTNQWIPDGVSLRIAPPVDNEGADAPQGTPAYFTAICDDIWSWQYNNDQIWIYEAAVDWNQASNSTFALKQQLNVAAFNSIFDTQGGDEDIEQPPENGAYYFLPSFSDIVMNSPKYRNFGSSQRMVLCHTVNVGSGKHGGVRWYELIRNSGVWSVRQQGTFAPDAHSRFLPSISINSKCEIAIGYSVSSANLYPGLRFCGQSASANASASGLLDISESIAFTGSQTLTSDRYGDYCSMSVDPVNDETFWFTSEEEKAQTSGQYDTKIVKFSLGQESLTADFYAADNEAKINDTISLVDLSSGAPSSWQWNISPASGVSFLNGTNSSSQNPKIKINVAGQYDVRLIVTKGTLKDTLAKSAYLSVSSCLVHTFPYHQGFESMNMPVCIKQETISGNKSWKINKGNGEYYPANSYSGTRNVSITKDITEPCAEQRLILPDFDFTGISSAMLNFRRYQENWYGDADTLAIYYKTSSSGAWQLLQKLGGETKAWRQESLILPNINSTYFISFVGMLSAGHGISLDDIYVVDNANVNAPVADFSLSNDTVTMSDVLSISDESHNFPAAWSWSITPSTFVYVNGTGASSQHPQVKFTAQGVYSISLSVANAAGNDSKTKTNCIYVHNIFGLPFSDDFETGKGWTFTGEFQLGTPQGLGGSGVGYSDPSQAFSGTNIIGTDLSGLGSNSGDYEPNLSSTAYVAESPYLDFTGYNSIRLRFKRHLNVSSGDNVSIMASDDDGASWNTMWSNWGSAIFDSTWKEVEENIWISGNKMKIRFVLENTDGSLNESGWNIDDIEIFGEHDYCFGRGQSGTNYIQKVDFGSIHKESVTGGFQDHTYSSMTTLIQGQQNIELKVAAANSLPIDDIGVWIDWNIDGDFDDDGENPVCSSNAGGQGTFYVNVPSGANTGISRMRIRVKRTGNDCGTPCQELSEGEVEDYKLKIIAPTSYPPPFVQEYTDLYDHSVKLHWIENGTATQWEIELRGAYDDFTGTPTHVNITSTDFSITGLIADKSYRYYVRSKYPNGKYSVWEHGGEFHTEAEAVSSFPYLESFETYMPPDGWKITFLTGDYYNSYWLANTQTYHPTGKAPADGSYLAYFNAYDVSGETYYRLSTKLLDLSVISNAAMSFYMYHDTGFIQKNGEGLRLQVTENNKDWVYITSLIPRYSKYCGWSKHTVDLSDYDGKIIKIGFVGIGNGGNNVHIDGVKVHNNPPTQAVWLGSDTCWYKESNWNTTDIPYPGTDIIIPPGKSNYPTITTPGANCKSLEIQSTVSGDASLITHGYLTVKDTAIVQRYSTGGAWHGYSSPLDNVTASMFNLNMNPKIFLYKHDESYYGYSNVNNPNLDLGDMKGWFYWVDATNPVTLNAKGILRDGQVGMTNNLIRSGSGASYGWNFMGNPYTSAIDWKSSDGWTTNNISATIYVYKNGNWATFNKNTGASTNGGSRYLALGQAFFVKVNDAGGSYPQYGTMIINEKAQVHNNVAFSKNNEHIENALKLIISDGNSQDETMLMFHPDASTEYDPDYDAIKLFSIDDKIPQIYSGNNIRYAVQTIPQKSKVGISVRWNKNGKKLKLKLAECENIDDVFLLDKYTGESWNLSSADYDFSYSDDIENRFVLSFEPMIVESSAVDNLQIQTQDNKIIVYNNDKLNVESVEIFDLLGRILYRHNGAIQDKIEVELNKSGIYFVRIYSGEGFRNIKIAL
jgi:PKD repeat protein